MIHKFKIWPEPYEAVIRGYKKHEVRRQDRPDVVTAGDELILEEWDPRERSYTGRAVIVAVTYATPGGSFGLPEDVRVYSIGGLREVNPLEFLSAAASAAGTKFETVPIPMILWCPNCNERHIDTGIFTTKPHHTHACQGCGFVWRQAIVPTVGVQFLPGFKDAPEPRPEPPPPPPPTPVPGPGRKRSDI